MLTTLPRVLLAILVLEFVVIVHELGHLKAAQWLKVPVEEFSIGFGKALMSRNRRGITYSLRVIPLGGYVRFRSDDDQTVNIGLYRLTTPARGAAVMLAGIAMNFIVGYVCLFAAAIINGRSVGNSIVKAGNVWWTVIKMTFSSFVPALQQTAADPTKTPFSGPIGIVHTSSQFASSLTGLLVITATVSMAIGIFNLLPIPAFDGGQCLLGLWQHARHRALSHLGVAICAGVSAGFIAMLFLIGLTGDIARLIGR